MRRRLLNLLTVLSLLLCVAIAVMWVRSYFGFEHAAARGSRVSAEREVRSWRAEWASSRGGTALSWARGRRNYGEAFDWAARSQELGEPVRVGYRWEEQAEYPSPDRPGWLWTRLGLHLRRETLGTPPRMLGRYAEASYQIIVPYFLPWLISATLPAARMTGHWVRRRRSRVGRCPACGYDLRASPGRCPECGSAGSVSTPT